MEIVGYIQKNVYPVDVGMGAVGMGSGLEK